MTDRRPSDKSGANAATTAVVNAAGGVAVTPA
jgi:hypothetical protein